MRQTITCTAVAGVLALTSASAFADLAVTWRGIRGITNATSEQLTGLSGISYAGGNTYWAVRDNSNTLFRLEIDLNTDASLAAATAVAAQLVAETRDFEGIAVASAGRVLLAEEGTPAVRHFDLASGAHLETLPTPAVFSNRLANLGFESLALTGDTVWTANEEALSVDGPRSTSSAGSVVRLLSFDLPSSSAGAQYAYVTDPIHASTGGDRSGLADLVALPDGRLLALERSAAASIPAVVNRIYEIDFTAATDVSGMDGLAGETYTPVTKRLLWQGTADNGLLGQNMEGLTLGPEIAPGRWVLIGVIDDGDPVSTNSVVAFELTGIPEPGALGLIAVAAVTLLGRRVRRRGC